MAAQNFSESFSVGRSPGDCWDVLVDVATVSSWVSVVGQVTELEHLVRYTAVLEDRLGPFKLRADLDVDVTDLVEGSSIGIRADGEDRQVGSRIVVDATLSLKATEGGCDVNVDGRYEVTGRVATMGASTIKQKAEKILREFVAAAERELA